MFSYEFCKIFQNAYFQRTPIVIASLTHPCFKNGSMTAYKFTPLTVGTIEVIFWKTVALEIERSHLKVFCEIAYGKSQAIRQMFVKFQLYIYDGVF